MLHIDDKGWVVDDRITVLQRPKLHHGEMDKVNGIIVHETGAKTAQSTLNSYLQNNANGAHFLIDKDGTIYQTGSVLWRQFHVGNLQVRCIAEHRCDPVEAKKLKDLDKGKDRYRKTSEHEMTKSVPDRYPSNADSIGIEMVGGTFGPDKEPQYEKVTAAQNASLQWLVAQLRENFGVPLTEIFRHPIVSYKDEHEAESAQW